MVVGADSMGEAAGVTVLSQSFDGECCDDTVTIGDGPAVAAGVCGPGRDVHGCDMTPADRLVTLTDSQLLVMDVARGSARAAYVPYSNFHVGAAVLTDDGIVGGCNIENASYGLTNCAERTALFSAIASGYSSAVRRPTFLAVTCPDGDPSGNPQSVMPCGACRQVMSELLDGDALIAVDGVGAFTIDELLPQAFTLS